MGKPSVASELIGLGGSHRPDPDVLKTRLQERDRRLASDMRTEAEKLLGDPPPSRSALAQNRAEYPEALTKRSARGSCKRQ